MYCCISGIHPQPANEREQEDKVEPLRALARQAYSDELIEIVEWCLKLDHLARPQSAFELQRALMKEVRTMGRVNPDAATEESGEIELSSPETTLTGRLKATLNRKIF